MLARVRSGALRGIDALVVDVEVDVSSGLPHTTTVGLPDGAVREASDRIRAALRNAGFEVLAMTDLYDGDGVGFQANQPSYDVLARRV